jgi:hypothetical protein
MNAAGHGKHIGQAMIHLNRATGTLDKGVNEEIAEDIALLCADTALLIAEMEIARARRSIRERQAELAWLSIA